MDHEHQVIVAARATGQVSDKGQAVAMTRETILNTGETPRELSADAGYYSAQAVAQLEVSRVKHSCRSLLPQLVPFQEMTEIQDGGLVR